MVSNRKINFKKVVENFYEKRTNSNKSRIFVCRQNTTDFDFKSSSEKEYSKPI